MDSFIEETTKKDFPGTGGGQNPDGGEGAQGGGAEDQFIINDSDITPEHNSVIEKFFSPMGIKSVKEVAERLTAVKGIDVKNYPSILEQAGKAKQLEGELSEYKKTYKDFNPYDGDADLYKYYEIKKKNKDDAKTFLALSNNTLQPLDIIKIKVMTEHPELGEKPDMVLRKIQRTYPALFGTSENPPDKDSQEFKDSQMDIELDANAFKRTFMGRFNDIVVPTKLDPETERANRDKSAKELLSTWQQPLNEIVTILKKFPVKVKEGEDEAVVIEIDNGDDVVKEYLERANRLIVNSNLKADANNIGFVGEFIRKMFLSDRFNTIMKSAMDFTQKHRDKEWRSVVFNPSNPKNPKQPAKTNDKLTPSEQEERAFKEMMKN